MQVWGVCVGRVVERQGGMRQGKAVGQSTRHGKQIRISTSPCKIHTNFKKTKSLFKFKFITVPRLAVGLTWRCATSGALR